MTLRFLLFWGTIILIIWWVVAHPELAAGDVHAFGHFLGGAASGLSAFVTDVFR